MVTTLLDQLRQSTAVDCDTMDVAVAETLGPFQDCTSNQAIAYLELSKPEHQALIHESVTFAENNQRDFGISVEKLAAEVAMVMLGIRILPHLTGRMHIQVDPSYAYDVAATVVAGERIVQLFQRLGGVEAERVCIKIPSTWEGLMACGQLAEKGINTLATTLFTIEQAAVAAKMKATYIAPYVNELAVHFEPGFVDRFPGHEVCVQAQSHFRKHGHMTKVLPASLISVDECMSLAGVDHMTIAPALLQQLSEAPAREQSTIEAVDVSDVDDSMDEKAFRMSMTRRDGGRGEIKQVRAINVFADFQMKLEQLMRK
ncbi:hypothetical protein PMZ80_004168 [Knufia obscura]|uniref:Transaldolase n=2 Tax=Knufia TaxID=430999 RepID=A0AAN8EJW8_9EURO|nr:hypothetical protein PMZ80_004168 [Knufia obscura]KAK5948706.1 hypothetical protein OHC33_010309 [Knufia fluminis]